MKDLNRNGKRNVLYVRVASCDLLNSFFFFELEKQKCLNSSLNSISNHVG